VAYSILCFYKQFPDVSKLLAVLYYMEHMMEFLIQVASKTDCGKYEVKWLNSEEFHK